MSIKTRWILVSVALDDGSVGWGEASSFGDEPAIAATLTALAEKIAESRPAVPGPAIALLDGKHPSTALRVVRSALEQALLDAQARSAGITLPELLGGPFRQAVPVYANINRGIPDRSPEGFADRARDVVASEPYNAIKIAPFDRLNPAVSITHEGRRLFELGVARVAAVRRAIGPDRLLLVDCHGRFDIAGASRLIDALAPMQVFWIEDTVAEHAGDADAMRRLRGRANAAGIRLAGAESTATLADMAALLAQGYYDCVLPDLRYTGVLNGAAMLRLAGALGVGVSIHNPAGPVLDAVSRALAAALPEFMILERQVAESSLFTELAGAPPAFVDGCLSVAGGRGHGCVPDAEVLSRVEQWDGTAVLSFAGVAGAGGDA